MAAARLEVQDPQPGEDRAARRRRLARERQQRKRARDARGDRVLTIPAEIADELGDDTAEISKVANEILRQWLAARLPGDA